MPPELTASGELIDSANTCTSDDIVYSNCGDEVFTGTVRTHRFKDIITLQHYINGVKEGNYTSWYADGTLRCSANYSGGLPDGPSQCFYPSGQMRAKKEFNLGKQLGKSLYWYETGAVKKQYEYLDGLQHGVCTEWFESGKRKTRGRYVHGVLQGKVTYWYESGMLRGELEYHKDKIIDGDYRSWHEDGTIRSIISYKSGLKNGKVQWWDKNGIASVGVYKNDVPSRGHIADWYIHGNRALEYLNENGNAQYKYWSTDGHISRYVELQNGLKHGIEIEYFENGAAKIRRSYEMGKLKGSSTLWYENGQEIATYSYKEDELLDGQYQTFYPDGRSQTITSYRIGHKNGQLVWWNSQGEEHQSYYSSGRLVDGLPPPFDYEWHRVVENTK